MSAMSVDPRGPYTLWRDYGTEGWNPEDFETLDEAVAAGQGSSVAEGWAVTKPVKPLYMVELLAAELAEDGEAK